ncbi:efflux RND transporter periplasmic adaptor subunit [Chitinophaga sp. SYP-B3965]|uniref:efflux RND transporter periplasmic adaptor subunit n=1 Tax=Chitinophaga sp. SYP-B3965 TaxID=2663120 RepID=UPI001299910F|nr:efflux RND transporter periplasmic adaptor subunit [Chitinophaga sp. SYP-B3965]MRG44434.1 efflux RND transporter periplasmic adaptor subunit [Chitinophaga sp. SYP-B3965]
MRFILILSLMALLYSCAPKPVETTAPPPVQLPVIAVVSAPANTYQDFFASLEGTLNVDIRPQVDGYLEKIYVDEGAYVKAGQPLFKINDRVYAERSNNTQSGLELAEANVQKAKVEIDRLIPLVKNNVVSGLQLQTATAEYEAAKASVASAKAMQGNARINMGYTLITAPVNGYIGRIPFKTGSLVGKGELEPLTVLSDVHEIYAYFSMSEPDFMAFKNKFSGNTMEEKIKQVPLVELIMADNQVYDQKGKIEIVEGQFDKTMGAISFRATFPNPGGTLRTGNTGKVRITHSLSAALIIPQEATFEMQDQVYVYAVAAGNKVTRKAIHVLGKTSHYYYVDNGIPAGDKIVLAGTGNLKEGAVIAPQLLSADSLLKANPLY